MDTQTRFLVIIAIIIGLIILWRAICFSTAKDYREKYNEIAEHISIIKDFLLKKKEPPEIYNIDALVTKCMTTPCDVFFLSERKEIQDIGRILQKGDRFQSSEFDFTFFLPQPSVWNYDMGSATLFWESPYRTTISTEKKDQTILQNQMKTEIKGKLQEYLDSVIDQNDTEKTKQQGNQEFLDYLGKIL